MNPQIVQMPPGFPFPQPPPQKVLVVRTVKFSDIIGELSARAYMTTDPEWQEEINSIRNCLTSGSAHCDVLVNVRNSAGSCFEWIRDDNFRELVNLAVFDVGENQNPITAA